MTSTATATDAPPAPPPPVDGRAAAPRGATGLPQLLTILKSMVAPTTLLTALLFYFGWMHTFRFFEYFGINSTLLGLTTQDYLMRSIDALFVPLAVVAAFAVVAIGAHVALVRAAPAVVFRTLLAIAATAGVVLFLLGFAGIFTTTVFGVRPHPLVPPLSLSGGVLLLVYVSRLLRRQPARNQDRDPEPASEWSAVARWAAVFMLVSLGLFWAVADYALLVGSARARQQVTELADQAGTLVYSAQSLSLQAPGVHEVVCSNPDAAYRYRYDGLKLVLQSGDQYVFLPESWSPDDGVALLLPRSDSLRLEFIPPAQAPPAAC